MIDVFPQSFSPELAAILYFFHNVLQWVNNKQEKHFTWTNSHCLHKNVENKQNGHADLTLLF